MHSVSIPGAIQAPPPSHHGQAARVAGRVRVSPELAGVIAGLAWGSRRRDDDVLLVAVTGARVAAYAEARG